MIFNGYIGNGRGEAGGFLAGRGGKGCVIGPATEQRP